VPAASERYAAKGGSGVIALSWAFPPRVAITFRSAQSVDGSSPSTLSRPPRPVRRTPSVRAIPTRPGDRLPDPGNGLNPVRRFAFWLPRPLITPQRAIPPPSARSQRSAIERAFEFRRLLDGGVVNSQAEIAKRYGISRARVTQLLNLLKLPQSVLGLLLESGSEEGSHCTERQLRPILRLPESAQIAALQRLQERNREGWLVNHKLVYRLC